MSPRRVPSPCVVFPPCRPVVFLHHISMPRSSTTAPNHIPSSCSSAMLLPQVPLSWSFPLFPCHVLLSPTILIFRSHGTPVVPSLIMFANLHNVVTVPAQGDPGTPRPSSWGRGCAPLPRRRLRAPGAVRISASNLCRFRKSSCACGMRAGVLGPGHCVLTPGASSSPPSSPLLRIATVPVDRW